MLVVIALCCANPKKIAAAAAARQPSQTADEDKCLEESYTQEKLFKTWEGKTHAGSGRGWGVGWPLLSLWLLLSFRTASVSTLPAVVCSEM